MARSRIRIMIASILIASSPLVGAAVETCRIRVDPKDGTILAFASGVGGHPRWGYSAAGCTNPFFNESTCINGDSASKCEIGAPGTAERISPSALCLLHLCDDGPSACTAYTSRCTPGLRGVETPTCDDGEFLTWDGAAFECRAATTGFHPVVRDSSGQIIGPLLELSRVGFDVAGQVFIFTVKAHGIPRQGQVFYSTTNCTGTPYVSATDSFPPFGAVQEGVLYVPDTTVLPQILSMNSMRDTEGAPCDTSSGMKSVFPAIATDISGFTAPLRVEYE